LDLRQPAVADAQLAGMEPRGLIGVAPNAPHQAPRALFARASYQLAIVEFDDQGRCYDRRQMDAVAGWLADFAEEKDVIIVVFVHGWKHDARGADSDLVAFEAVLDQTVRQEADHAAGKGAPRPVLGVFVGWRGLSFYDRFGIVDNVTFWDRQQAGRRVAVGSVRELFGRFHRYRKDRKEANGAPLVVIVGHSFGGMIVYSALAQSLIEAASAPFDQIVPGFADLVLLVNPAVEAARYLPIYDLTKARMSQKIGTDQPPVFVCATAQNDWATGFAFPLGNAYSYLSESWLGLHERQAMVNTIGHLPWLKTHDLAGGGAGSEFTLTEVTPEAKWNPFWVVQAAPIVINGHNGIFLAPFLEFVAQLVFAHVSYSRSGDALRTMRDS
jgi:hypothetical protein